MREENNVLEDLNFSRKAFIKSMADDMDYSSQMHPQIGVFWYDPSQDELFGVNKTDAEDVNYVPSDDGDMIKSYRRLHKDIWRKMQYKNNPRFFGDYTLVPRGRVSEYKDKGFVVFVGDWIDDYPSVKDDVLYEFELPEDTKFVKDEHWNLGHGWSEEYL